VTRGKKFYNVSHRWKLCPDVRTGGRTATAPACSTTTGTRTSSTTTTRDQS